MKFSIYTTLYLVNQNNLDYESALFNFSRFADEVVISTCPAGFVDDTLDTLKTFIDINKLENVNIVLNRDINFNNPLFDGILKDTALQHCSNEIVINLDGDEYIPLSQKYLWEEYGEFLLNRPDLDGISVHTVDLMKDVYHYKSIGQKPYISKKTGLKRGVVNYAKKENGHIDITKSDTCELIKENGDLASIMWQPQLTPEKIKQMGYPYVLHTGWINSEYREKINKWWKPVWEHRSGSEVFDIITDKKELENVQVQKHGLELW